MFAATEGRRLVQGTTKARHKIISNNRNQEATLNVNGLKLTIPVTTKIKIKRMLKSPKARPKHENDWNSCLDYTCEELQNLWKFPGKMPPCPGLSMMNSNQYNDDCSPISEKSEGNDGHSNSNGETSSKSNGGNNGSNNSGGGNNGSGNSGGGNNGSGNSGGGNNGTTQESNGSNESYEENENDSGNGSVAGDSEKDTDDDTDDYFTSSAYNESKNYLNNNMDDYLEYNNEESNADGKNYNYNYYNENDNGAKNGGDDDKNVYDPYEVFDLGSCSTYEDFWLWDLSLTCEDEKNYESCACTTAEILYNNGAFVCPEESDDPIYCPSDCSICDTCLKLLQCTNTISPERVSTAEVPLARYPYFIGAAVVALILSLLIFSTRRHAVKNRFQTTPNLLDEPVWLAPMT